MLPLFVLPLELSPSVEGAFDVTPRGTPKLKNRAPRDELKSGRGRGSTVGPSLRLGPAPGFSQTGHFRTMHWDIVGHLQPVPGKPRKKSEKGFAGSLGPGARKGSKESRK